MSIEIKKYHNKILKHMKTFGITIYHILIHCIGSKLELYVSFRIPLYFKYSHCDSASTYLVHFNNKISKINLCITKSAKVALTVVKLVKFLCKKHICATLSKKFSLKSKQTQNSNAHILQ